MMNIKTLFAGASAAALVAACSGQDAEYTSTDVDRDADAYVTTANVDTEYPADPVTETELSETADEVFEETTEDTEYTSIVAIASDSEDFDSLTDLVVEAELVDTLNGVGPFTVFAPTDDAFAKLDADTVADLKKPENQYQLQTVLTYHVVPGTIVAADLITAINDNDGRYEIETVQGGKLIATLEDDGVKLTDAKGSAFTVVTTDIAADNGVIHVIDGVMMPS